MRGDGQPAPPAARAAGHPKASLGRRYAAVAYESLLVAAVVLVTGFLMLPLVSPIANAAHPLEVPPAPARVLSACAVFGVAGIYCVWFWTGGRRTLPMKTWRLLLVRRDGTNVDIPTAVIRYLTLWIGPLAALVAFATLKPSGLGNHAVWLVGLNYVWALVDRDRQFLHDRIAGTRIAWERSGSPGPAAEAPAPEAPPPGR